MTLLGELHGHNLQPGLSISHLTRAISMENVCEHPPDPFLLFLYQRSQNVSYSSPTPSSVLKKGPNKLILERLISFHFLAPAVLTDDLGRELLDKGGGKVRGKLGERKLICPWAVGQNTVPALFSVSAPSLRNDDTLLQARINLLQCDF